MFCKHCGHELSETDKFCAYCGQPAENTAQSEAPKAENPDFQLPHIEEPEKISQPIIKKIASKPVFLVFTIAFTVMLASFAFSVFAGAFLSILPLIFGIFVDIALWTLYGLSKKENENDNPAIFNKIRSYATCQRVFTIIAIVGLVIALISVIAVTALVGANLSKLSDIDLSSADKVKDSIQKVVDDAEFEEFYGKEELDELYEQIDKVFENDTVSEILTLGIGTILMIVMISVTVVIVVTLVTQIISAVRYKKMALFCDDLRVSWISGMPMKTGHTGLRKLSVAYGVLSILSSFGSIGVALVAGNVFSGIISVGEIIAVFAFASVVKELDNAMKEASEGKIY